MRALAGARYQCGKRQSHTRGVCGDYDGAVSFDTTTGMVAFEYDARFIQIIAA